MKNVVIDIIIILVCISIGYSLHSTQILSKDNSQPIVVQGEIKCTVEFINAPQPAPTPPQPTPTPPQPTPTPPQPTPTPPQPTPPPVVIIPPDGQFKIAAIAYNAVKDTVKSNVLVSASNALGKNYNNIADKVGNGDYNTLKDIFIDLKNTNDMALLGVGEDKNNWDKWDNILKAYIVQLNKDGKLKNLSDYEQLLNEIAGGLKLIK